MTSADYAKAATISFDAWCHKMLTGKYVGEVHKRTAWYKAGKALEVETHAPAPPPPDALAPYRSILFMGQSPGDALAAPAYYRVAFTADPAYDGYASRAVADRMRDRGMGIYVWYVPTEVSKARADEVAARLGAPVILGQCETTEQYDASVAHGRRAMVGNLSALRADQLAKVASGERIVVVEDYWNCGGGAPDWRNANAGVPCNCIAVYGDGQCARKPLSEYIAAGRFVPHRDSVYGPGMTADDWGVLT